MSFKLLHTFSLLILAALSVDAVVQDFYWRDYIPGDIPYDAIRAAPGRYIGQVNYKGKGNIVGTIFPHIHTATIEHAGRQDIKKNIKILCSPQPERFYWEYVDFTKPHEQQMKEAIKGGYFEDLDVDLFIGKAVHESEWKIGKVHPIATQHEGLWIWNVNRASVNLKGFHLLKYNSTIVGPDGEIVFQSR